MLQSFHFTWFVVVRFQCFASRLTFPSPCNRAFQNLSCTANHANAASVIVGSLLRMRLDRTKMIASPTLRRRLSRFSVLNMMDPVESEANRAAQYLCQIKATTYPLLRLFGTSMLGTYAEAKSCQFMSAALGVLSGQ